MEKGTVEKGYLYLFYFVGVHLRGRETKELREKRKASSRFGPGFGLVWLGLSLRYLRSILKMWFEKKKDL